MANLFETIRQIDDSTTLQELIDMYQITSHLPKQGQSCATLLKAAIYKKTGLDELENDIEALEEKTLSEQNVEAKQQLLANLRTLYNFHKQIIQYINTDEQNFECSYQDGILDSSFNAIGTVKLEGVDEIYELINEAHTRVNRDINKINLLINEGEVTFIKLGEVNSDSEIIIQLHNVIQALNPLDLYQTKADTLQGFIIEIDKINGIQCSQFKQLIEHAIRLQEDKTTEQIEFLIQAKDYFQQNKYRFSDYPEDDKNKLAELLNTEITDDTSYTTWFSSFVYDYPVITQINNKIAELEQTHKQNQENLQQSLEDWDSIFESTFTELRQAIIDKPENANRALKDSKALFTDEISTAFPVNPEDDLNKILTDDYIVKRQ